MCFVPAMQARVAAILTILVLTFCPSSMAGGKPKAKFSAAIHMETDGNDNPKMVFTLPVNGRNRVFSRMPEISTKDIVSFNPFPTDDGSGYGMILKLTPNAARRLAAVTNANIDRWMLAQVNGRPVDAVLIDKQIDDGIIVVWKGITLEDIALFEKSIPRIGEEDKKK
jgi:hypothetical protein